MRLRSWIGLAFGSFALLGVALWVWHFTRVESRAQRGDAEAQYELGKRFVLGQLAKRDPIQAVQWLRRAAEQGHPQAQASLGLLYARGQMVPKDYAQALKWLSRAANQGSALAQNQLGTMYAQGKGVERDLLQAARWYGKAAAQGAEVAKRNLALVSAASFSFNAAITTRDGKTYRNAVVQKVEPGAVTVTFQPETGGFGVAKLKVENLPDYFQYRYGGDLRASAASNDELSPWSQLTSAMPRG